ncbi:MAG TPA: NAD(P)H-dependent oxidoreductase [Spirochaetia bacterium]|nr:NAD(P)H-dependent oxidoreductase [Spirochaetia bacterium]
MKACLISGSLRGAQSSSHQFLQDLSARLTAAGIDLERGTVRADPRSPYLEGFPGAMHEADAIVFAFPLFTYSLPGALTRLLEDLSARAGRKARTVPIKVFAIINCGFPRPRICADAIRVIRNFCQRLGYDYRFSVAIGGGPVTVLTRKVPVLNRDLKRAYDRIVDEIRGVDPGGTGDVYVKPVVPERILLWIKDRYEQKTPTLRREPA